MTETLSKATVSEWAAQVTECVDTGEALGLSPCEALKAFFPAIVGDDVVMRALASLIDPARRDLARVVEAGIVPVDVADDFLHNIFHVIQVAAALGHALGVDQAMGAVNVPTDLSDLAWDDLPDTFGDDAPEAS